MTFEVRNFKPEEFQIVLNWTIQEGYNPGMYDYIGFQSIDQKGFWVGTLNGEPITALAVSQYDQNFASVAWYFTKKQFRGQGYGLRLWKQIFSRVNLKNAALNSVVQQEENYKKYGFKTIYEIHRYRYQKVEASIKNNSPNLIDCRKLDIKQLSKFDRTNFPVDRTKFLQTWINLPKCKPIAYVKQKQILGYGVLRLAKYGHIIGPLYAESHQIALQIFNYLLEQIPQGQIVLVDIPSINQSAKQLVDSFNMKKVYLCLRMELAQNVPAYISKTTYAMTSLSFG